MTIKKKPSSQPGVNREAVEKFLQAAPDAKPVVQDEDEKLQQISMTISKADLARVDAAAKKQRISRAGFIRQSIFKAISE